MVSIPEINGISVIVPVHNEADNVIGLLEELVRIDLQKRALEFIFVDDNSSDNTAERLSQFALKEERLRVVRHQDNYGQSAALRTGARRAKYNWLCTLDGDGQNDPADIVRLLDCLQKQAPDGRVVLIIGDRSHARKDNRVRRVSSLVASRVRAWLLGDVTPDSGCGLKLISKEGYLSLPYFDHMHRFLPTLVLREGGRVHSVPVNHRPRLAGQSHYGVFNRLWVGIIDILGVMWLQRRAVVVRQKKHR